MYWRVWYFRQSSCLTYDCLWYKKNCSFRVKTDVIKQSESAVSGCILPQLICFTGQKQIPHCPALGRGLMWEHRQCFPLASAVLAAPCLLARTALLGPMLIWSHTEAWVGTGPASCTFSAMLRGTGPVIQSNYFLVLNSSTFNSLAWHRRSVWKNKVKHSQNESLFLLESQCFYLLHMKIFHSFCYRAQAQFLKKSLAVYFEEIHPP